MNKLHVSLLAVLFGVVSGVNAREFSLHESLSDCAKAIGNDAKHFKKIVTAGRDIAAYTYAPNIVGAAKHIVPGFIKAPALPAAIAKILPNAVNAQNANRILTAGLVELLVSRPIGVTDNGSIYAVASLPLTTEAISIQGKEALNGMKDSAVAITAVELLSWAGNLFVANAGGERAEEFLANHSNWVGYAKVLTYAIFKQVSAVTVKGL